MFNYIQFCFPPMQQMEDFEEIRRKTIEENNARLKQLGLPALSNVSILFQILTLTIYKTCNHLTILNRN